MHNDRQATLSPGVQAILNDPTSTGADLGGDSLTDTDNGVREPNAGWEDGVYEYHDLSTLCMAVDSDGPGDDGFIDTGFYTALIDSNGAYDNTVCGTACRSMRMPWST